ncbi:MAG: hypothetical protein FJ404_01760 [Verrucomicrobia bacterium]|nr:hypothetical protein [Verrucomicrobiota bacterium]
MAKQIAIAPHANDDIARHFLADTLSGDGQKTLISLISLFSLAVIAVYSRAVRKRIGRVSPRPDGQER